MQDKGSEARRAARRKDCDPMKPIWVVACLLGVGSSALLAADCAGLKNLKLDGTNITLAEPVTGGVLEIPEAGAPMRDLPAFCRVTGVMRPTSDSQIRFEVWMPEQGWNGHFLSVGNGGFAGSIWYGPFASYLKRGFAVAGSDAGHQAEATDASWAYGHPEKVKDFGWRAVHLTSELAKQMIKAYYGKPEEKAFFESCSDGGREALMEAQRFPEDYDGILAGAPANAWSTMLAAGGVGLQNMIGDLDATSADLSRFATHGGKLILYHGWNDPAISPWNSIAYYKSLQQTMGEQKAASFVRLYMAPGVEHCSGGPGPSAFGQFGLTTEKGPKYGLFDSLEDWVEKGSPADDVFATKYATGADGKPKAVMTRPLCAYPMIAKYKGSGDSNDADSFVCAMP
jgi:hypothetical protein